MNFSLKIAKRYLFSKSENKTINFISWIAGLGVVVSTFALIVVLSAFAGLKEYSIQFTGPHDPDARILPLNGKVFMASKNQLKQLENLAEVHYISKVIEDRVLLDFKQKNTPAILRGVDAGFKNVVDAQNSIVYGSWMENEYQVIMSNDLARTLSIGIMDPSGILSLMVPKTGKGQITDFNSAFRKSSASVSGIFSSNDDKEKNRMYSDINFARSLFNVGEDEVSMIEVKLVNPKSYSKVEEEIKSIFKGAVEVRNKLMINDELYRMLNTEYIAVYFICTLVVIIALFNVIGSVIMSVLDKKADIITLNKLGASQKTLVNVFKFQGFLMTLYGAIVGLLLGVLLLWSQIQWEWFMISYQLPYPVQIELQNIGIVIITVLSLGFLASYIASKRVKNIVS